MNEIIEKAKVLRSKIEELAAGIDDSTAVEYSDLFPLWDGNDKEYAAGDRVRFEGILYRVLQPHTSQSDWTPDTAHSLFAEVLIPDPEVIPEWVQPESTNPYMKGDKVKHNGRTWICDIDNNVWEPGVYGWTEITE